MIFLSHLSEAKANTKDKVFWKRKFALLPVCVSVDETTNTKTNVWLQFYEVRKYWEDEHGWWCERRLPGASISVKEEDNPSLCDY